MRVVRDVFLPLLLVTLLVSSCERDTDSARLHRAQRLWQSYHVTAYRYTVQTSCFCLVTGPIEAEVRNGVVVSWRRTDGIVAPDPPFTLTVDSLFAKIARASGQSQSAVTAEYDHSLGYPTSANIDWVKNAVDDEVAYQVLSLTVLERDQ